MECQHKIRNLPREGKVIVISDLHGNVHDFNAVVEQSKVFERMAAGEKLYFVIMGDICDVERHKIVESDISPLGDVDILDHLIEIRKKLSDKEQLIYLEGNHDFHILRIFEEIRGSHLVRHGHGGHGKQREDGTVDCGRVARMP